MPASFTPPSLLSLFPTGGASLRSHRPTIERIGLLGLLLFSLGFGFAKALSNLGLIMMLFSFLASWHTTVVLYKKEHVLQITLAIIGLIALYAIYAGSEFPRTMPYQIDTAREMLQLLAIFLVAWWVGGTNEGTRNILIILTIGIFIGVVINITPEKVDRILNQNRVSLGMNAQHFGLICAILMMGTIVFVRSFLAAENRSFWKITIWVTLFVIGTGGVYITQSRAAVLVVVAVLILLSGVYLARIMKNKTGRLINLTIIALLLAVIGATVFSQYKPLMKRFHSERINIAAYQEGNFDALKPTSIGLRFILWKFALEKSAERPLIGWGPGTTGTLVLDNIQDVPARMTDPHLHNSYFEIVLRFGLIGVILFGALFTLLIRAGIIAYRQKIMSYDIFLFLTLAAVAFAIANLTEAYIDRQRGWHLAALIFGLLYSYQLHARHGHDAKPAKKETDTNR